MESVLFALSILLGVLLAGAVGFVTIKVHWVSKALKTSQQQERLGEEETMDLDDSIVDEGEEL